MPKTLIIIKNTTDSTMELALCQLAKANDMQVVFLEYLKFSLSEICLKLTADTSLVEHELVILQQICISDGSSANDAIIALLQTITLLKKQSPRSITVVLPYLYYSRQTTKASNISNGLDLLLSLLDNAGINKLVTCDMHQLVSPKIYNFELINVMPSQLYAAHIKQHYHNYIIVAPDNGSCARASAVAEILSCPVIKLIKTRHDNIISYTKLNDSLTADAHYVIIDDIIDSGQTILQAARLLEHHGAKYISAYCTHNILNTSTVDLLANSSLAKLHITDTISFNYNHSKLNVISIVELLWQSMFVKH